MPPNNRSLKDVLIHARQVAASLHHRYLGVEHTFIALIQHPNTPAHDALRSQGVGIQLLITSIQRYTEIDTSRTLWEGHPHTPRLDVILGIAHDIALEDGRGENVVETDIWQAIQEEGESLPLHIIKRMKQTLP